MTQITWKAIFFTWTPKNLGVAGFYKILKVDWHKRFECHWCQMEKIGLYNFFNFQQTYIKKRNTLNYQSYHSFFLIPKFHNCEKICYSLLENIACTYFQKIMYLKMKLLCKINLILFIFVFVFKKGIENMVYCLVID